jgi:hypothetical protein
MKKERKKKEKEEIFRTINEKRKKEKEHIFKTINE